METFLNLCWWRNVCVLNEPVEVYLLPWRFVITPWREGKIVPQSMSAQTHLPSVGLTMNCHYFPSITQMHVLSLAMNTIHMKAQRSCKRSSWGWDGRFRLILLRMDLSSYHVLPQWTERRIDVCNSAELLVEVEEHGVWLMPQEVSAGKKQLALLGTFYLFPLLGSYSLVAAPVLKRIYHLWKYQWQLCSLHCLLFMVFSSGVDEAV